MDHCLFKFQRETSNLRVPDNRSKPQSTIEVVGHGDDEECENDPKYANNVTIPLTITMSVLLGGLPCCGLGYSNIYFNSRQI